MTFRHSAALLAYRIERPAGLQVFLGHMGGPFWESRDDGGWSIPKGEFDPDSETPIDAARREFAEEIGAPAPGGTNIDLGVHVQSSGKRIYAFAVIATTTLAFVRSNTFDLEWPNGSGRVEKFPELDRADWFDQDIARRKLVAGQVSILDTLVSQIGDGIRR